MPGSRNSTQSSCDAAYFFLNGFGAHIPAQCAVGARTVGHVGQIPAQGAVRLICLLVRPVGQIPAQGAVRFTCSTCLPATTRWHRVLWEQCAPGVH